MPQAYSLALRLKDAGVVKDAGVDDVVVCGYLHFAGQALPAAPNRRELLPSGPRADHRFLKAVAA
jgi:hypothetical protein